MSSVKRHLATGSILQVRRAFAASGANVVVVRTGNAAALPSRALPRPSIEKLHALDGSASAITSWRKRYEHRHNVLASSITAALALARSTRVAARAWCLVREQQQTSQKQQQKQQKKQQQPGWHQQQEQ